ncbi:MAG TPA: hypothetical protein VF093_05840 [Solirubrobacterales bacterium]
MFNARLHRLIAVLGITSLIWLLPIPVASASCSGGGGGGGEEGAAAMDLTPNAEKWLTHYSKKFVIENTGFSSWKIDGWTHGTGYEVYDPSNCLGKTLPAFSNDECDIWVHGYPFSAPSTLTVTGSSNGMVVASDTSKLN